MKPIKNTAVLLLLCTVQLWSDILPAKSLPAADEPVLVTKGISRSADEISFTYNFPQPTFESTRSQRVNGTTTTRVALSNCPVTFVPGEPELPKVPVRIIIPYGKTVDRIEVVAGTAQDISLSAPLSFAEQEVPLSKSERVHTVHNEQVYSSDMPYPALFRSDVEMQKAFGISIAKVDLYPMRYIPRDQVVKFYPKLSLVVHLKSADEQEHMRIDVERFRKRGALTEENEAALATYPQQASRFRADSYNYVLITSEEIANENTVSPSVQDLIDLRESQGYSCKVMTTEEIERSYEGSASNEKIRNFIKHAYNNWGTEFVTLCGDINVVAHFPERVKYGYNFKTVDTDMPYQCLDEETWGGDFEAEVYVGRISAENAQEVSNQIHKILTYETEPNDSKMLSTSLGAGQNLDWNNWGARAIEYLYSTVFPEDWEHDSIYQQFYAWEKEDFVEVLATNQYGNVDHDGHGSVGGTMKFDVGETHLFTNTKYPFLYTLSCQTGDFSEDCIAEHFITEHKIGGYFGGVLNSEVGLYMQSNSTNGSSPTIHRSFWEAYWERDIEYFSQMNAYSHQMNSDRKFTCCTTNYFGDAATRFRGRDHLAVGITSPTPISNRKNASSISSISMKGAKLSFHIPNKTAIAINLYSLNGKRVRSFPQQHFESGANSISLETGNALAKGIYLVEFKTPSITLSKKLSL